MLNKCINPRNVNYIYDENTKKHNLIWKDYKENWDTFTFNCGKCIYCQQKYSRDWAVRLMLESKSHKQIMFLTLTYNNENLPNNNSINKRDPQLFLKRLRKKISPIKIRYFLTGEYGGRKGRGHYHLVIFGYQPPDLNYLKHTNKNEMIYTSKQIEKIWGKGFISIGINLNINTLKYVAKYLSKLSDYDPLTQMPPFSTQSRHSGIGANAFDLSIYETDGIYLEGKKYPIPRYFDKLAEQQGYDLTDIKKARDIKVKSYGNTFPTLQDKKDYIHFIEQQGYNTTHLFKPSHKNVLKTYLPTNSETGEVHTQLFNTIYSLSMQYHKNSFFELWDKNNTFIYNKQVAQISNATNIIKPKYDYERIHNWQFITNQEQTTLFPETEQKTQKLKYLQN